MDSNIKHQIMKEIESKGEMFKQLSETEYRIRCPICGDSQKNLSDAHCYIKCVYDTSENIKYNCFKCNNGGSVGPWFLKKLGASSKLIFQTKDQISNTIQSINIADIVSITGSPILDSPQTRFLEKKLGSGFTIDDYERFKIIWDMEEISKYISSNRIRNTLPSNFDRIQFLSDDKSVLLSRTFLDSDHESQWRKIKIFPWNSKSYYTIRATLDIFTDEIITVNIAEGILDILSVYKNFNDGDNSVYIATLGSDYIGGLEYMISKGFVGDNVVVKIYIDSDVDEKILRSKLKKFKWIFNKIVMYKNVRYKDMGTTIDRIKLVSYKV